MIEQIGELRRFVGHFSGIGTNHENEKFVGQFDLSEIFDGKGFQIKFSANADGNPKSIFHSEFSTIAPSLNGSISLFNFNTNTPFLAEHQLVASNFTAKQREFIFRFGNVENKNSFREEIRLELMNDNRVGYHYSWGMPGGDFSYRSGVVMEKKI